MGETVKNQYDSKLCSEIHNNLNDKIDDIHDRLDGHDDLLKEHAREITSLKEDSREYKTEIRNLIKKMDSFITIIMWGIGILVTVALFFLGIYLKK